MLRITVGGLPSGERPSLTVSGPGIRRHVSAAVWTLARARPGAWTLRLRSVHLRRSHGALRRGATASPQTLVVRARLLPGGRTTIAGQYGTIVNPGLVELAGRGGVVGVTGPPSDPAAVTFAGHRAFRAGQVLSLAPSGALPHGLLARVTSVALRGGRTTVRTSLVSPFAVVPVASFSDVPLSALGSEASALAPRATKASCQAGPSNFGVWRDVSNVRLSGGWNTTRVLGVTAPVGVHVGVEADVSAGVSALLGLAVSASCELDVGVGGKAVGVPVFAGVYGKLSVTGEAGLLLSSGVSMHVSANANTVGVPPVLVWRPELKLSNSRVTVTKQIVLDLTATIGIGIKATLGEDSGRSATVDYGDTWTFKAQPGACSWTAVFGQFTAEGKLLGWTITPPDSKPLYTNTFWRDCADTGGSTGGTPGGGSAPSDGTGPEDGSVQPLTPTSFRLGFTFALALPECPEGDGYSIKMDGVQRAWRTADGGQVLTSFTPGPGTTVGVHRLTFACQPQSGGKPEWTDSGFPIDITGSQLPVSVQSTSVHAGGPVVFFSGASDGPSPCPPLGSTPAYMLTISANSTSSPLPIAPYAGWAFPDSASSETLTLPTDMPAGPGVASVECDYNVNGSSIIYTFADTPITIGT